MYEKYVFLKMESYFEYYTYSYIILKTRENAKIISLEKNLFFYSQFIGTNLKLKYKRSKTMQMQINYVP